MRPSQRVDRERALRYGDGRRYDDARAAFLEGLEGPQPVAQGLRVWWQPLVGKGVALWEGEDWEGIAKPNGEFLQQRERLGGLGNDDEERLVSAAGEARNDGRLHRVADADDDCVRGGS